jgi:Ca2+-binding EF-hand superfamily protein
MTKMALKFPRIRRSFKRCENVFNKHAGEKEYVPKDLVRPILVELGADEETLTDAFIDDLVKTANLDGDDKIDFKEFLIAAAVGVFLTEDAKGHAERSEEFKIIRQGFLCVKETFDGIDVDLSGEIDYEELKTAFLSMRSDDLIEARLKELDINGDKSIEFPEFIFGMCSWVGMEDDDESEDDYDLLSPQPNAKSFRVEGFAEAVDGDIDVDESGGEAGSTGSEEPLTT